MIRAAAQAGFGDANGLLDLTPYQLIRLLTPTPKAPAAPAVAGDARVSQLRGLLA